MNPSVTLTPAQADAVRGLLDDPGAPTHAGREMPDAPPEALRADPCTDPCTDAMADAEREAALAAWVASRPPAVRDLIGRFPMGSRFLVGGVQHFLVGYGELEGGRATLQLSATDPAADYEAAVATRFDVDPDRFGPLDGPPPPPPARSLSQAAAIIAAASGGFDTAMSMLRVEHSGHPRHGRNVPVTPRPKCVGRNDPCPCASGKKFKQCCKGGKKE